MRPNATADLTSRPNNAGAGGRLRAILREHDRILDRAICDGDVVVTLPLPKPRRR